MPTQFEAATAVRRRSDGFYDGDIADGWDIGGNANGGYIIALAARAMADAVGRPPLSVTAHYLAPGRPGPVEIEVTTIRAGRRMATARATVSAGGAVMLALLGTFADPVEGGPSVIDGAPPDLPPTDQCTVAQPPVESGFHHRVRTYVRPIDAGFRSGNPSGTAEIAGWFEMPDGEPADVFGLLMASDSFAPVVFNRPEFPVSWSPTLELTVHIRGVAAPGPLRCRFFSNYMSDGLFEESGELWDSTGNLVALSRQIALIPRPAS